MQYNGSLFYVNNEEILEDKVVDFSYFEVFFDLGR